MIYTNPYELELQSILLRPNTQNSNNNFKSVNETLLKIKDNGNKAIKEYVLKYNKYNYKIGRAHV